MPVLILSKELERKAKEELNEIPDQREEYLKHIKEWLGKQPHLKTRNDDLLLLNFLRGSKFSLQKTKETIDMYYTLKSLTPEFFGNRDPFSPELQNVLKKGILLPIESPDMTILLFRWKNANPNEIPLQAILKLGLMFFDIFLFENPTFLITGFYVIEDFEYIALKYLQQATPMMCKKYLYIIQKGYPLRMKALCMLDSPSVMETVINTLIKPFVSKKILDRIQICASYEDLHKRVPKSLLPVEYGGEGASVEELSEKWKTKMESYRDWFLDDANYCSNEKLRPGKPKTTGDVFGLEGSFRRLELD